MNFAFVLASSARKFVASYENPPQSRVRLDRARHRDVECRRFHMERECVVVLGRTFKLDAQRCARLGGHRYSADVGDEGVGGERRSHGCFIFSNGKDTYGLRQSYGHKHFCMVGWDVEWQRGIDHTQRGDIGDWGEQRARVVGADDSDWRGMPVGKQQPHQRWGRGADGD